MNTASFMYCQVVALLKATILSAPNADIKIACVIVYVLETRTSTGDRHVESTILTHTPTTRVSFYFTYNSHLIKCAAAPPSERTIVSPLTQKKKTPDSGCALCRRDRWHWVPLVPYVFVCLCLLCKASAQGEETCVFVDL